MDAQAFLCPDCQATLPWLTGQGNTVEFVERCVAPLRYQNQVRESVHRYKFQSCSSYGTCFGTLVGQCVQDCFSERFDVVTWVPLSKKRKKERGFDQAYYIAKEAGKLLTIAPECTLRKVRHTDPQSSLTEEAQRRANVLGVYEVLPDIDLTGRRVLIIDDVMTSGATLSECARKLRMAGAQAVFAATLAQAGKRT